MKIKKKEYRALLERINTLRSDLHHLALNPQTARSVAIITEARMLADLEKSLWQGDAFKFDGLLKQIECNG
jgi:hypothetical protein